MTLKKQKLNLLYQIRNTKYQIRLTFLILVFTFYFLNFNLSEANAQSVSLGIYPPVLRVMIKPGRSITQVYKVLNQEDPVIVKSSIGAFSPQGELGDVSIVDCSKIDIISCEAVNWFSFQNADLALGNSFFLGSNKTQEVVLKISVPEYASEGDYYNNLIFTTNAPPGLGDLRSKAEVSIVSNILITVSNGGTPTKNISIEDFSTDNKLTFLGIPLSSPFFDSFDSIPVILKLKNNGTAYTEAKGKISLLGFPGLSSDFNVPPQTILAGGIRQMIATPSGELSSDHSLVLPEAFYIGKYNLNLKIENEDGSKTERTIYFFSFPFKIIFIILIIILAFLGVRKFKAKRPN